MVRQVSTTAGQSSSSSGNDGRMRDNQSSGLNRAAETFNPRWLRSTLLRWENVWGVKDFACHIKVAFSPYLKRSLGRSNVTARTIHLSETCRTLQRSYLLEVICHEAAHIAVHAVYGKGPKPHGEEWQQFVRAAGFEPCTTASFEGLDAAPPGTVKGQWLYQHRCPVCQTRRTSSRPVSRWRCAECVDLGMEGYLVITRIVRGRVLK